MDRDPRNHPIHEYAKLAELLGEAARKLGLYIQGVAVVPPGNDTAPVMMQASFTVGEVAVDRALDPEQAEFDDQFKDILRGEQETEEQRTLRELKEEFGNSEGLFGDGE